MPRTVESTVYKFDELSPQAKERARDWYRQGDWDTYWTENVFDDAIECGRILGIEIDRGDGKSSLRSHIYWSGFSSQGDGACFEGRYAYAKGAAKAIRKHAPANAAGGDGPRDLNALLHGIADDLQAIQAKHGYKLTATMRHRGHYYHSGCMSVDVERSDGAELASDGIEIARGDHGHSGVYRPAEAEAIVTDCMRRFADWIYRQLEAENEYRTSDDYVDETIEANEYEFTAEGKRA